MTGAAAGFTAGTATTAPLFGIGAIPGAAIGALSGFSVGLSTGLLFQTTLEITGLPAKIEGLPKPEAILPRKENDRLCQ